MSVPDGARLLRVLNLGAGVQSTTLYLMACNGELAFDVAIFADTQEEPQEVYRHLDWLKSLGVCGAPPIVTATAGRLGEDLIHGRNTTGQRFAAIPAFTTSDGGKTRGMTKRQCSKEYKTEVIARCIRREVLGLKVGASEAEPFWTEFLRSLNRRGLRGVKLVISDSHEGIKAATAKVLKATWQRCRVHFMRNALAHAGKTQRRMVSAAIGTVFVQDSADAARAQWRSVADQLRGKFPKLGALMDDAENEVLAFMTFPRAHWTQIYSTNPLERLNAEIKRRTNVVGIFPNDKSIVRLVGAMMLEQSDEWSLNRRYMQLEGLQTLSDTVPTRLSAVAR